VIVLGVDPHKDTHTIVAVDEAGRPLRELTVAARSHGHGQAIRWAHDLDAQRRWAVEDGRHVSRLLERDLLAAGEAAVRVAPKLMAGRRRSERSFGKSDAVDALAVARAALARTDLPAVPQEEPDREMALLVRYRDELVGERTRMQNRLRWLLHGLDPDLKVSRRALGRPSELARLSRRLRALGPGSEVRIARAMLRHIAALSREVDALAAEVGERVQTAHPQLLAIPGCGPLSAATLVAEAGGVERFPRESCFAMYVGVAPLDCSSGRQERHRLNRFGNRRANAALHRIAVTQVRVHPPAQALYARKQAEGHTRREALRVLKRHLARVVYRALQASALT
jgi:transposase